MPNRRNAAMPSKGGNMTGDPSHHPEPALLMEYASGASPEPFSLVIATHLALCPECRRSVAELEAAGGAALGKLHDTTVGDDVLAKTLAKLDAPPPAVTHKAPPSRSSRSVELGVPRPLSDVLSKPLEELHFKKLGGVEVCLLDAPQPYRVYVMRIAGGVDVPPHGHSGQELTLMLRGSFVDGNERFAEGDMACVDEACTHRPKADREGCICLVAAHGKMKMPGFVSGMVARWFGI
ncbi:MAG TPA: ChrR family anti-sigma-E factor [Kofleriaceae bacterium]|nr:ChrR family anti-sigma-E factor [Kofleriaceae bacterium]